MTTYFILQAPYPALASTVILPSPEIGNNMGLQSSVNVIKMEDGSRRSYIKKRHQWNFIFSRDKMEELQDFVRRYRGETFKVTWRERSIIGKATLNPVEFRGEGRAGGWGGDEAYSTTLEIVEV